MNTCNCTILILHKVALSLFFVFARSEVQILIEDFWVDPESLQAHAETMPKLDSDLLPSTHCPLIALLFAVTHFFSYLLSYRCTVKSGLGLCLTVTNSNQIFVTAFRALRQFEIYEGQSVNSEKWKWNNTTVQVKVTSKVIYINVNHDMFRLLMGHHQVYHSVLRCWFLFNMDPYFSSYLTIWLLLSSETLVC
jgi:hypothetical protein